MTLQLMDGGTTEIPEGMPWMIEGMPWMTEDGVLADVSGKLQLVDDVLTGRTPGQLWPVSDVSSSIKRKLQLFDALSLGIGG